MSSSRLEWSRRDEVVEIARGYVAGDAATWEAFLRKKRINASRKGDSLRVSRADYDRAYAALSQAGAYLKWSLLPEEQSRGTRINWRALLFCVVLLGVVAGGLAFVSIPLALFVLFGSIVSALVAGSWLARGRTLWIS